MAILGVGRVVDKPVIHDGEIVKGRTMYLNLTFDHRIVGRRSRGGVLAVRPALPGRPLVDGRLIQHQPARLGQVTGHEKLAAVIQGKAGCVNLDHARALDAREDD